MRFVLDIMQVTFVTKPTMDLPTASFNSQGMGTQAKTSNVTKHMPTQFQLYLDSERGAPLEGPIQCLV